MKQALFMAGVLAVGTAWGMDVVKDGRGMIGIWFEKGVEEEKALFTETRAANELADVLERMTGSRPAIHPVEPGGKPDVPSPAIVLGRLAASMGVKTEKESRTKDGYRVVEKGGRLFVAGESAQGVYHGVFVLLEEWGCGWYAPGFVGEVIPKRASIAVPKGFEKSGVSDSVNRRFWYGGKNGVGVATALWNARNKAEMNVGSWNHAWGGLVRRELFETQPELFGLKRGARSTSQLCTANPETVRIATDSLLAQMEKRPNLTVYAAGPNDGGNLCECAECAKMDTPGYIEPSSGKPSAGDRVFLFASELAARTAPRFPGKDLGILIYSDYSRPPVKMTACHPNVFPMFAPIRRCRLHGPNHPGCAWGALWGEEIAAWGKLTRKLGFYMYNYNLADALLPLNKTTFYKKSVEAIHAAGADETAWIFETIDAWASHAPHLYLSVRLAWNSRIDIDAEMARYYSGFYGAAAEPMQRYWTRIDEAYATAPTHTGSSYGQHHIWTAALLQACRADITAAQRLAADAREREAVAMAEAGLRGAELFMRTWNAVGAFDFLEAGRAQADLKAHIQGLADKTEPCWVHERYSWGYFARFVGETVSGGEKVMKEGGAILVRLPFVWKFRKDEKLEGVAGGWFQPGFDDAAWGELATFSKSWDDQGLGMYHGDGWYRARFEAPQDVSGDVRLWFGGFDENVDVYLNGQPLGEKRGFARPAEFADVGNALKAGAQNVIAVRVSSGGLAEMGTGGIMMPVMLYRAGAGEAVPVKEPPKKGVEYEM